jgi:hypothetical protein
MKTKLKAMIIYILFTSHPWYKFWYPGSGAGGGLVWFMLGLLCLAAGYFIRS